MWYKPVMPALRLRKKKVEAVLGSWLLVRTGLKRKTVGIRAAHMLIRTCRHSHFNKNTTINREEKRLLYSSLIFKCTSESQQPKYFLTNGTEESLEGDLCVYNNNFKQTLCMNTYVYACMFMFVYVHMCMCACMVARS